MSPKDIINQAKELLKGKRLANYNNEYIPIKLHIVEGTNEYNTSIYLSRNDGGAFAYFCNGLFWTTIGKNPVNLIP